jgi:OOP family OmpA-OmpF porin
MLLYILTNKSTPTNVSTEGTDFILTYLRNNPTAKIDIVGHADELVDLHTMINYLLPDKQCENTLVKANIDASRLNVVAAGEDTSSRHRFRKCKKI